MDFIEQLPPSAGFTSILVIIERLTKQSLFILMHDTIGPSHRRNSLSYSYSMSSPSMAYWDMLRLIEVLSSCHTSSKVSAQHSIYSTSLLGTTWKAMVR